ncbi:MAG: hypothetical protein J0H46_04610 [Bacteroidetes bacterium]|nr:hypothetical protein [Bacteroidota bacterium]
MKTILLLILSAYSVACFGQQEKIAEPSQQLADTVAKLLLNRKTYDNDRLSILELYSLGKDGYRIDSSHALFFVIGNKKIASFRLPIPDDEVKNFQVGKITETKNGFKMDVTWGGGENIYRIDLYFIYRDRYFYLYLIKKNHFMLSSQKEMNSEKKLKHLVPIDKVDIFKYL